MEFTVSTLRPSGSQEELDIVCCPVCHNLTAAGDEPTLVELSGFVITGGGEAKVVDESLLLFLDRLTEVSIVPSVH